MTTDAKTPEDSRLNLTKTIQWGDVICRVTKVDGGLIDITTPHGTVIRMGACAFADKAKAVEDRGRAASLLRERRRSGKPASTGTACWAFRLLPIVARVIGPLARICGIYPSIEFTLDRLDHQSCWTDWSDGFGSFCRAAEHLAESERRYPDRRFRITCKLVFDAYAVR